MKYRINDVVVDTTVDELIGRWTDVESSPKGPVFEELYFSGEGIIYLYGNEGVLTIGRSYYCDGSMNRGYKGKEEIVKMEWWEAREWACRYLSMEDFEKFFGETTELKKVLDGLREKDLYQIYKNAGAKESQVFCQNFAGECTRQICDEYHGFDPKTTFDFCLRVLALHVPNMSARSEKILA